MQSKKNKEKKQEVTPCEEQVTTSLEEYSNIKKRLHELGGMGPSMQSQRGEETPVVVPETLHIHSPWEDGCNIPEVEVDLKFSDTYQPSGQLCSIWKFWIRNMNDPDFKFVKHCTSCELGFIFMIHFSKWKIIITFYILYEKGIINISF